MCACFGGSNNCLKQQTEKAEARAKVQHALMKKLAGTTWGADAVTLKRLYTGRP